MINPDLDEEKLLVPVYPSREIPPPELTAPEGQVYKGYVMAGGQWRLVSITPNAIKSANKYEAVKLFMDANIDLNRLTMDHFMALRDALKYAFHRDNVHKGTRLVVDKHILVMRGRTRPMTTVSIKCKCPMRGHIEAVKLSKHEDRIIIGQNVKTERAARPFIEGFLEWLSVIVKKGYGKGGSSPSQSIKP